METRVRAVLDRKSLTARVREALTAHAVVYVQAPLGYGKTTLARAVLVERDDVAWYEGAPWDATAFVAPIVEAIRVVRGDFGRRTLALIDEGAGPDRLGATLATEFSNVDRPIVVTIDDAHILDAQAFGAFMNALVRRLPASARFFVLSRAAAPFALSEAVVRGMAATFDARDLRFHDRDAAQLAALLALDVSGPSVASLVARTDGWPAGITLALRTGASAVPEMRDSSDAVGKYLVDALLGELATDDVALLEALAVYESLASLDIVNVRERLAALERRGAMVSASPDGGYRIHPLLRETMVAELRARDAAAVVAFDRAAAAQYARLGRTVPALFHLERSGDPATMLAFLREYALAAIFAGHIERVGALVARVRGAGLDAPALFAFIDAYARKGLAVEGSREGFASAVTLADAEADLPLAFAARVQLVEIGLARERSVPREAIDDLIERSASLGPAERMAAAVRAGWFEVLAGRFEHGLALATEAPDAGDSVQRSFIIPLRAYAHIALGAFEEADREITALLGSLERESPKLLAGALGWAARFALLRGEMTAAWEFAQESARLSAPYEMRAEAAAIAVALGEAAIHAGIPDRALDAAAAAERAAGDAWYARDAVRVRAIAAQLRARASFLQGDLADALARSRSAAGDDAVHAAMLADAVWYAHMLALPETAALRTEALAALATARPIDGADAIALADAAERLGFLDQLSGGRIALPTFDPGPFAALVSRRSAGVRFAALGAMLAQARRDPRESAAFSAGMKAFVARGERFEAALASHIAPAIGGVTVPSAPRAALEEPLTPREAEILALLVAGLTNKEIADRLVVSVRTAETHVARILGKLGVSSRARAIAKAIALGLASTEEAVV
jgi:LuxR family maltose regulon positive regulatory protein